MKIIVSMDQSGWIVAKNAQGEILGECFFKTDDETDEELSAFGYQRLVQKHGQDIRYASAEITGSYPPV